MVSNGHLSYIITWLGISNSCCRLQAEVEEVLEGRTEVTHEDLEKLQYTEQVWTNFIHMH